jgi:hypothetical protein
MINEIYVSLYFVYKLDILYKDNTKVEYIQI